MTNRFKGLDLIDRVPEELWMEVRDIVQEAVINHVTTIKIKIQNISIIPISAFMY